MNSSPEQNKAYYERNKDRAKANAKEYYKRNREKILQKKAEYRQQSIEIGKDRDREQYIKHKDKREARQIRRTKEAPERRRASSHVQELIKRGKLLPASAHQCTLCPQRASDYHHRSYLPEHLDNVIPLCRSCHVKVHHRPELAEQLGSIE